MLAATLTAATAGIQATPVPGWAHVLILGGLLVAGIEGAIARGRRSATARSGQIPLRADRANTKASRA